MIIQSFIFKMVLLDTLCLMFIVFGEFEAIFQVDGTEGLCTGLIVSVG